MSEPTGKESFAGPLSRSALAQCLGSSATSLSLEGREGSRTARQDGQNGQDRTAGRGRSPFTLGWRAQRDRLIEDALALTMKRSST
jgi:hypothetical protein